MPSSQLKVKPSYHSASDEIEAINNNAQESIRREKAREHFIASLKRCQEQQAEAGEAKVKAETAASAVITALADIAASSGGDADSLAECLKQCEEEAEASEVSSFTALQVAEDGWARLGMPPPSPGELPLPWWCRVGDPRVAFEGDPEDDVFRLRAVIAVLDSVCDFFGTAGVMRRRMCDFLVHLQRYMLAKHSLPLASKYR